MNSIILQLRSEGFDPDELIPDGKIHRFKDGPDDKKKCAWYLLHRNFSPNTQEEFYTIVYNSWRLGDSEPKQICTLSRKTSQEESILIKNKIAQAKKKAEAERIKQHEESAHEVKEKWDSLSIQGNSEYLNRKKIADCPNLDVRFDNANGDCYAPIKDIEGRIWSIQKLPRHGSFKPFHAGSRTSGLFYVFGDVSQFSRIFFAEGFATAASIHLATGVPCVCTFSAGNLSNVSVQFRKLYPDKEFTICGDDDRLGKRPDGSSHNAGRISADKAASGCNGIAEFPRFTDKDLTLKDWNDLLVSEGADKLKEQLLNNPSVSKYNIYPLGHRGKEYFFTSTANRQIISINSFSKRDFFDLMPLAYWETNYPSKQGANWDSAMTCIMEQCRKKGLFQSRDIRGAGVWLDDNRIVVNMGDHLVVDGMRAELGDIRSKYFYTLGKKLPGLHTEPLTQKECNIIINACSMFKWKKSDFGYLLAGAMVTTRVCGALPIRPHLWLTGEKGSGKTTLFNRLIEPLIGEPIIYAAGNSTEAGIRQSVSADAVPVMFDEFENNGSKSAEIIQSSLDLMRVAWSETNAVIIKGGASGAAQMYQARFAAIVTSIRQISMSDADRSRFATIELAPHENDIEHWKKLESLLNIIDKDYGNRLFARTISMMPILLKNFKTMKSALNRRIPGQRFGDQYGMLLAGYGILTQDEPLTEIQGDYIADLVTLDEAREAAKEADHHDCLLRLLTSTVPIEGGKISVLEMIEQSAIEFNGSFPLKRYGLGLRDDCLFVANESHAELRKLFRDSRWSEWSRSLRRLDGAYAEKMSLFGKDQRGTFIPMKHVFTKKNGA